MRPLYPLIAAGFALFFGGGCSSSDSSEEPDSGGGSAGFAGEGGGAAGKAGSGGAKGGAAGQNHGGAGVSGNSGGQAGSKGGAAGTAGGAAGVGGASSGAGGAGGKAGAPVAGSGGAAAGKAGASGAAAGSGGATAGSGGAVAGSGGTAAGAGGAVAGSGGQGGAGAGGSVAGAGGSGAGGSVAGAGGSDAGAGGSDAGAGGSDAGAGGSDAGAGGADAGAGGDSGAGGTAAGGAGSGGAGGAGMAGAGPGSVCGNEVCEKDKGESCSTCAGDCGVCDTGGKVYYVSTSGDDANDGLSEAKAWKTLAKVQSAGKGKKPLLAAGDSVLFKKGDTFVGTIAWDNFYPGAASVSGAAGKPLTFASYGSGPKPRFEYPTDSPNLPKPADRRLMGFFGIDYMTIDGLEFTDTKIADGDKMTIANMGIAIQFGVYSEAYAHHCTVQNVDMSKIGLGIVIVGNSNTVDHCTMVDLKNLVDTKCADPNDTGMCSYEDYGANGITLTGNDNFITNNYFSGNYAHSYDFTYNGGAIEAFADDNGYDRNTIMYNTAIDCDGFMEIGSNGTGHAKDNLIAYNLFINNGSVTYASLSGTFATDVSNAQYLNNTIVETPSSRYAGAKDNMISASNGTVNAATLFRVINNVFYLTAGDNVLSNNAKLDKYVHDHNLFHFEKGSATPFPLDPTEVLAPGALFVDTSNADPTKWDYHLLPGAPGQGAGKDADFTRDILGVPPGSPPDIGAFESP